MSTGLVDILSHSGRPRRSAVLVPRTGPPISRILLGSGGSAASAGSWDRWRAVLAVDHSKIIARRIGLDGRIPRRSLDIRTGVGCGRLIRIKSDRIRTSLQRLSAGKSTVAMMSRRGDVSCGWGSKSESEVDQHLTVGDQSIVLSLGLGDRFAHRVAPVPKPLPS